MQKGCFGSIFCNDASNSHCRTCDLYESCARIAFEKSKAAGKTIHGDRLLRDHVKHNKTSAADIVATKYRVALTDEQRIVIADEGVSVKARALIRSIYGKSIDGALLLMALHECANPFAEGKKPFPLFVACRDLINSGFINRKRFTETLMREGEMQRKNAASSAGYVIEALIRLNVLVSSGSNYILRVVQ